MKIKKGDYVKVHFEAYNPDMPAKQEFGLFEVVAHDEKDDKLPFGLLDQNHLTLGLLWMNEDGVFDPRVQQPDYPEAPGKATVVKVYGDAKPLSIDY